MYDLRSIREQRKLTQDDLASLSGLPQSHLSALERGRYLPNQSTRRKIEMLLGHSIDWQQTVSGDKSHITAKMLELLNLQADGVLERVTHVKRLLHSIEQSLKTMEQ